MKLRHVTAVSFAAAIAFSAAAPASAQEIDSPVTVTYRVDEHGVGVGTAIGRQPLVGAWTYDGRACAGFSYQVPQCLETDAQLA